MTNSTTNAKMPPSKFNGDITGPHIIILKFFDRVVESIMVKGELDKVEKLAMSLQSGVTQMAISVHLISYMYGADFVQSQNPNSRKGGLIGLAATAIGLGANVSTEIIEILIS